MSKIDKINITVESKTVKGGKTIKMTVRNIFYITFWDKIRCMWNWYWYHSDTKSWKSYLNSPVTYIQSPPEQYINAYHDPNAVEELTKMLNEEINKKKDE